MSTSDAPNLRRLARQLADYGRRLRHLETVPQLSNSSLDNQGMHVYDADGNVSVTLGKQEDGTYSARPVAGPTPPAPVGLDAEGDAGLIHASWQGVFWAGAAMPRDFEAVEVLVDGNVHGAIHDPDGGSVTVPAFAGEREVSFRTLSQAGRRSDATGHVTVTVQSKASVQLDEARGRIDEAKADSAEALVRVGEAEATVEAVQGDLDTLETVTLPGAVAELEAADSAVEQALQDARDALESDIATVRTSVDGKNAITQSVDAPPTQYDGAVGDRWERMSSMGSGGSLVSNWRWNGTVWVSTIISDAVLGNVDAAKIGTGYLNASRIEAGTVTADKLLVGAGGNLIAWGQVTSGITTEPHFKWANSSNLNLALAPVDSGRGVPPHMVVSRYNTSSENYVAMLMASSGRKAPGVAGESYTFSVKLYSDTPGTKASIQLATYTSDGTSTSGYIAHIATGPVVDLSPEPLTLTIRGTAPEGTQFLAPLIRASGPADIGVVSPSLRTQVGATLIEDGAITTGKLLAGAVTAEKITVTEALSANIVDAMSLNSKKLVVTEEAILNHATLIGDTVVDNINVTGKLIGTDGVFTGTVDFENVNVTGLQLVEKLEANSISADLIEGGAFVGESFTGGTFIGGEFRTSDALPGQVRLADDGYVTSADGGGVFPGIGVTPLDDTDMLYPAGIGPSVNGLTIYGGKRTAGGTSVVQANPSEAFLRTFREDGSAAGEMQTRSTESYMRTYREDGTTGGVLQTSPTASLMRTYREDGTTGGEIKTSPTASLMRTYSGNSAESGWVRVRPQDAELGSVTPNNTYLSRIKADASEASMFTSAGGHNRYLSVDADGVWVKTNKGGSWKHYNLEETAQDSGWTALSYASGFASAGSGGPFQIRRMGGMIHLRGRLARTSGTIVAGTQYTIGTLSSSWRPAYTQRTLIAGGSSSQWGRIEVSAITGEISIAAISGNMNWVDLSGTLWTVD